MTAQDNGALVLALAVGERAAKDNLHWMTGSQRWAAFCGEPIKKASNKHRVKSYVLGVLEPAEGQKHKHKDGTTTPCDSELPHRSNSTVVQRTGVSLDADFLARDGDPDGDRMRAAVANSGLEALVHETYSSKPGDPRYRLVFPLAVPVPSSEYGRIARVLMTWLGWDGTVKVDRDDDGKEVYRYGPFDRCSERFTHFMFAQASETGEGYRERFRGRLLDPGDLALEDDPKPRMELSALRRPYDDTPATDAHREAAEGLLRSAARAVARAGEGNRNNTLFSRSVRVLSFAAAGALDKDGVVKVMTEAALESGLDEDEVERTLDSAWDTAEEDPDLPTVTTLEDAFADIDLAEGEDVEPNRCPVTLPSGERCPKRLWVVEGDPFPMCEQHWAARTSAESKGEPSTWKRQDVAAMLARMAAGEVSKPAPTVAHMGEDESQCLFYPGRINTVFGESGSGKTWLVLLACSQEISRGNHVVFIDFEDDLSSALARLKIIGATDDDLTERFHYMAPEEKLGKRRKALATMLETLRPTLVVIDSTGESLALEGLGPNNDDDVAKWLRVLPKACTGSGAAVAVVDHVTKAEDGRGAPIGSQRKRAGTYSAFYVEVEKPFSQGLDGSARIVANKDKAGHFRKGDLIARLVATARPDGLDLSLAPVVSKVDAMWDEGLLVKISTGLEKAMAESADDEWLGASRAYIEGKEFVTGYTRAKIRKHLDHLVTLGHVHREKRGQSDLHTFKSHYVPSSVFSDE